MMRLPSQAIWPKLISCMLSVSVLWMTLVVPAESINSGSKFFFKQALLAPVHADISKQDSPGAHAKSSCVLSFATHYDVRSVNHAQPDYQEVLLPVSARSPWHVYTSIHAP